MSANNQTEFPESFGYKNWQLQTSQVEDWIKRCMSDFPEQRDSTFMEEDIWAYNNWFKKWFSQFRNNKDAET